MWKRSQTPRIQEVVLYQTSPVTEGGHISINNSQLPVRTSILLADRWHSCPVASVMGMISSSTSQESFQLRYCWPLLQVRNSSPPNPVELCGLSGWVSIVLKLTLMAFCKLTRLLRTTTVSRLNLTISCTNTVFILCTLWLSCNQPHPLGHVLTWVYVVGYFLNASSVSNCFGSLVKMSPDTSWRISSLDLPPPEVVLACKSVVNKMTTSALLSPEWVRCCQTIGWFPVDP